MKLKNKIVVITGSNQGLGEVLAKKIAKESADVILLARRKNLIRLLIQFCGTRMVILAGNTTGMPQVCL